MRSRNICGAQADEIDELKQKLRDRVPSLDEFTVAFKEVSYTNSNSKQKGLARYILRKFAENYKYKYPTDFEDLTIEHLHPQSRISETWHDGVVGSLGNLIFLDGEMNEKLASKAFKEKQDILLKAKYSLPESVATASSWTPKTVEKHAAAMAEVAHTKIWKI